MALLSITKRMGNEPTRRGNIGGSEGHRYRTDEGNGLCRCECGHRGTRADITVAHISLVRMLSRVS